MRNFNIKVFNGAVVHNLLLTIPSDIEDDRLKEYVKEEMKDFFGGYCELIDIKEIKF